MLYRRSRGIHGADEEPAIPLSPLIDCVFLLLIFFLATTMLKRKESIIPVVIPDATSSLAEEAREDQLVIGLDRDGGLLIPTGRDKYGSLTYKQGAGIDQYLDELIAAEGEGTTGRPLRLDVERSLPFQKTIDAIDTAKSRGFDNVSIKIRETTEK